MVMRQEFDQFEPFVKRQVRLFRNDLLSEQFEYAEMLGRKWRKPSWYVREWLAYKNLRQSDLVARTELNKSQVSEFVNGRHRFNEDVLNAFADAIGVEPADLLRPPFMPDNELAQFVMKLDKEKRARALKILRAALEDEKAA